MMTTIRTMVGGVTALWLTTPVFAFQAPAGQEGFVPLDRLPVADQLPAAPLLITAYAFIWVAVFFYVWTLWRRLNTVSRDMDALAQRTSRGGGNR